MSGQAKKAQKDIVQPPTTLAIADAQNLIAFADKLANLFNVKKDIALIIALLMQVEQLLAGLTPQPEGPVTVNITQTLGYKNHLFTVLPFTSSAVAYLDLPTQSQALIVMPTVAAYVELDRAPNTAATPTLAPGQPLTASVQAKRINAQGFSASGSLFIWAFW